VATGNTTTTSLANLIQTYFQRRLLAVFRKEMKYQEFAFQRKIANANTTRFMRVEKISRASQKTVEGTPVETYQALSTNYLECTLETYGVGVRVTDWAQHDVLTGNMVRIASDRIALSMAEAADYRVATELARASFRVRQGLDSNHRAKGTASSGSTTTLVCSTLAGVYPDDYFNGGVLLVYDGTNKAIAHQVSDFTGSTCTFTFAAPDAFPQANDTTSKFVVYGITGMDSTFMIDTPSVLKMSAIARSRGMKPIGGAIQCLMPAFVKADFFNDDTFRTQSVNIPNKRFQMNQIGRWFNWQFLYTDQPYIESAIGAEDETSGVRIPIPVIGAESYSIARHSVGAGKFGIQSWVIDKPDHTNNDMSYVTLTAKMRFVPCVVNAENVMSMYTAYNQYF